MIDIPVQESPVIDLDDETRGIAFINRYDYTNPGFENEEKNEILRDGARHLIGSLIYSFEEDENYELILVDTLERGRATNYFPEVLPNDNVASVCQQHNTDLLLVLEYFNARLESEVVTKESEDGKESTNYIDLFVEAGFSLYGSNGVLIDRQEAVQSQLFKSKWMLVSWIALEPNIKKAAEEVNNLASDMGYYYLDNFYPSFRYIPRYIYIGRGFSEVTPLMKNQQWDEAIDLLMPLAHSPDPKLAKRAAHNLSIALKATGRIEDSDYWMNKANEE